MPGFDYSSLYELFKCYDSCEIVIGLLYYFKSLKIRFLLFLFSLFLIEFS